MSVCTLSIPADTEQVRVARLVACAAARRTGLAEVDVDDVRRAVGEAVGRAVLRPQRARLAAPVSMRVAADGHEFAIEVADAAGALEDDDSGLAMAVITGLVPGARITDRPGDQQVLRMAWPSAIDV
jgi:anti-sigma regulatory factor (Ser/Thr protein kinase)